SISASNALLKTLEEPPPYGRLILLASDPELLLPTIISRSQQISLRPVTAPAIQNALENQWNVDPPAAAKLARMAGGRVGWAVRAATEPEVREVFDNAITLLFDIMQQDIVTRFTTAQSMARQTSNLPEVLQIWLTCWRDVVLLNTGNSTSITHLERQGDLMQIAEVTDLHHTLKVVTAIEHTLESLQRNANKQLAMENLLLAFPDFSAKAPL
ncbi:MAG: hypothetical protein P1S60_14435, partial [Anaerolineae bacterium]|nr:hypothetical protein [Anaerolineae bacterium]